MAYIDQVYAVVQIAPTGIPTYVRLSQNENGRVLNFAISGDALPAGSTVALTGTKPDGTVYSVAGTLSDNVATFNEDEQLTAVAGEWDAKVEVTNSGNLIATGRIKFVIDADPSGGNIPSDSQLDGYIAEMLSLLDAGKAEAYGSPLVASTVAGMIDQSRVYVYTGSETGYTAGNWYYWNGSAWTSGGVYNAVAVSTDTTLTESGVPADAKATGDAIDGLRDDLNELATFSDHELVDFATLADGKYINPSTGDFANNSTYSATDYINVIQNTNYVINSGSASYGAWYDANKTFISGLTYNGASYFPATVTAPNNAEYLRFSCSTTTLYSLSIKSNDDSIYINKKAKILESSIIKSANIISVKPDGSGDFTTLKSAFESITDSSYDNQYIVEFYGDGSEYDVTSEFTSISNTVGLLVPPFTKLKGIGGNKKNILVARLDSISQSFSTLNIYQTSELEGLTIIGFNTRYAVHDDFVSDMELGHNRCIKDVHAISEKTYYFRAWGAGIRSGMNWTFEDCIFEGNQAENEGSFSCHNNVGFSLPAKIAFDNCRCKSAWTNGTITWGMRFSSMVNNANGIINKVVLKGTKTSGLFFTEENATTYGKGMLYEATGYANDTNTAVISVSDGNNYSSRIDLI